MLVLSILGHPCWHLEFICGLSSFPKTNFPSMCLKSSGQGGELGKLYLFVPTMTYKLCAAVWIESYFPCEIKLESSVP